ncbi:MAG: fused MFS/spermidine synthase [Spirochaetes bacterium]|nr:fused MFS/spermidine synthase [Spirochaetota bacterium]
MESREVSRNKGALVVSVSALGISSIITQLVVMRELLSVFCGNELVIGVILAVWLFLTGAGAWAGRYCERSKNPVSLLIACQILIAVMPFFVLVFIRGLRAALFTAGAAVSPLSTFCVTFGLLIPYCFVSGALLTLFCTVYAPQGGPGSIGRVYFIDNIGDIAGGLLFSFLLVHITGHLQALYLCLALNLTAAAVFSSIEKMRPLTVLSAALLFLSPAIFILDIDGRTVALQYPGQKVVYHRNSKYGSLVVTKTGEQLNFYENGVVLFSTHNTIANEEAVHYAMAQHDRPENVLLVSGGVSGTTKEILKYGPERIDYIELDPLIIEIGKRYTDNLEDERIRTIEMDARLFVKRAPAWYDVVIIDLPDPSTAQLNRFYTDEFFHEVAGAMREDAVLSIGISSQENYLSREAKLLNGSVYRTLERSFDHVIVIPGEKNRLIASDAELSYDIAGRIEAKGVKTQWVNRYYLPAKLSEDRVRMARDAISGDYAVNRDFFPVSYHYYLRFWLSQFRFDYLLFIGVIAGLTVSYLARVKPIPFAVFATGFTGASLEMVLVIGFQVLYGYVYHMIGVLVTMFMIGLAAGSFTMNRRLKRAGFGQLVLILLFLVAAAGIVPLLLFALRAVTAARLFFIGTQVALPLTTAAIGFLVGAEFPLAAKLHFRGVPPTAASLYSADLFGACLGALLVTAILIPLLGIVKVCGIAGGIAASGLIVVLAGKRGIQRRLT